MVDKVVKATKIIALLEKGCNRGQEAKYQSVDGPKDLAAISGDWFGREKAWFWKKTIYPTTG